MILRGVTPRKSPGRNSSNLYTKIILLLPISLGRSPPAPGIDFKKLKASTLHRLVVPYLHRKLGAMYDRQSEEEDAEGMSEVEVKLWHKG